MSFVWRMMRFVGAWGKTSPAVRSSASKAKPESLRSICRDYLNGPGRKSRGIGEIAVEQRIDESKSTERVYKLVLAPIFNCVRCGFKRHGSGPSYFQGMIATFRPDQSRPLPQTLHNLFE